jgi:isopenicillin N synthase-like dioxygenase
MATTAFQKLPVIDMSAVLNPDHYLANTSTTHLPPPHVNSPLLNHQHPAIQSLAKEVAHVFGTVGFAYLINHNISEEDQRHCFELSKSFYNLPSEVKNKLSTDRFNKNNKNSYRGFFPAVEGALSYKEG